MPGAQVEERHIAIDDDMIFGAAALNEFEEEDPWVVNRVIQRFCVGHNTIMGALVHTHDECEDVRILTHRQAMRVLFDGRDVLGGVA